MEPLWSEWRLFWGVSAARVEIAAPAVGLAPGAGGPSGVVSQSASRRSMPYLSGETVGNTGAIALASVPE